MTNQKAILRAIPLTLLLLGVSMLPGCAGSKRSGPRSIQGDMTFPRVFVSKSAAIKSRDITRKVWVEVRRQMPQPTLTSTDMYLNIEIQKWVGKTEALKGRTRAEAFAVKMQIKALVKIVDPITKGVVGRFTVAAQQTPNSRSTHLNPMGEAEDQCIEKFTRLLMKRLY